MRHLHGAAGFGTDRGDGLVGNGFDQRQTIVDFANHRFCANRDVLEVDFRRAATIDRRIIAGTYALRILGNDED